MKYILICIIGFSNLSCAGIRNLVTYQLELQFIQQGLERQNEVVLAHIQAVCCDRGRYTGSLECESMSDMYITLRERATYHFDMMRYLGRISDDRPQLPEFTVEGETLCE
jgi:hypothetical protein